MSKSIRVPNGIISLIETEFNCPQCTCFHNENFYSEKMSKSENGIIYKNCKGCKIRLGITFDLRGDVRVWLKKDEIIEFNKLK